MHIIIINLTFLVYMIGYFTWGKTLGKASIEVWKKETSWKKSFLLFPLSTWHYYDKASGKLELRNVEILNPWTGALIWKTVFYPHVADLSKTFLTSSRQFEGKYASQTALLWPFRVCANVCTGLAALGLICVAAIVTPRDFKELIKS